MCSCRTTTESPRGTRLATRRFVSDRRGITAGRRLRESPSARAPEPRKRMISAWIFSVLSAVALLLLASCSGAPRHQTRPGEPGPREPSRQDIVRFAKTFVGTPYRNGGTSYKGVDCSGFAFVVYREFDIRLPRTSFDQSRVGARVDPSDLKPADLLFFRTSRRSSVSHVGIYIGNGKFIHASTGARAVRIDRLRDDYYRDRYVGARRVLGG